MNDFIDNCRALEKSVKTIEQYKLIITEFIDFIEVEYFKFQISNLNKIESSHINSFLIYLTDKKGNQAITRRKKMSVLKSFFKYLKPVGKLKSNPVEEIESIKIKRKIPKYFAMDECKNIIQNVGDRNQVRNETIVLLYLNTGMRLSELVALNIQDIHNIRNNTLTITGKGNKERKIYFSPQIQEQIQNYLKERPKVKTSALFISERGSRMGKGAVQHMIKSALAKTGLTGNTHMLRHTFATQLYQSGVDIRKLQKMLGHSDISTTTIYTQVAEKDLQEIAQNNPLNALIK